MALPHFPSILNLKTSKFSGFWRKSRNRRILIISIIAAILIIGFVIAQPPKNPEQTPTTNSPQVVASSIGQLSGQTLITETAVIKSDNSAPLIARTGGRVTSINANIGQAVNAGQTIVAIDQGIVGNPTAAQVSGLQASLAALSKVRSNALIAAENAINVSTLQLNSTRRNQPLSQEQTDIARQTADTAVRSAELALSDARDLGNDTAIRNADLAFQQASFAQDQATLGRQLSQQQTKDAIQLAEASLKSSQIASQRIASEMDSQITQVKTQLSVAQAQLQQQQVTAPIKGQLVRLTVSVGDFLSPNQTVGEVIGNLSGKISLTTTAAIQSGLSLKQLVAISYNGEKFDGTITRLSRLPSSQTGLYQVDISIPRLPENVTPNSTVTVELPVERTTKATYVPLDALNVLESGPIVFTVTSDNVVHALPVTIQSYEGNYVAISAENISSDTRIVIEGNRSLRDGMAVTVKE